MTPENEEFINKWEKILEGVEVQRVDLRYVKKIRLNLKPRKKLTINVESMWKRGFTEEEIQQQIINLFETHGENIKDLEFVLDIPALSTLIQPETDQILNKL